MYITPLTLIGILFLLGFRSSVISTQIGPLSNRTSEYQIKYLQTTSARFNSSKLNGYDLDLQSVSKLIRPNNLNKEIKTRGEHERMQNRISVGFESRLFEQLLKANSSNNANEIRKYDLKTVKHKRQAEEEDYVGEDYDYKNYTEIENSTDEEYLQRIKEFIFPKTWTWVLIVFHLIVFFVGLVGNTLVCVAVYRNHTMRTVTNYFIVNLALADFLVILFCLPPTVAWDVTMTWFLGVIMCKIVLYLQVSCLKLSRTINIKEVP